LVLFSRDISLLPIIPKVFLNLRNSMNRIIFMVAPAVLSLFLSVPCFADVVKRDVPVNAVGSAQNGAIIVAQSGSIVYARKGSNVQFWPGSKLVPIANSSSQPDCSAVSVRADGEGQELIVGSGSQACTAGDTAVIALE